MKIYTKPTVNSVKKRNFTNITEMIKNANKRVRETLKKCYK